jgi:hypothetical protein
MYEKMCDDDLVVEIIRMMGRLVRSWIRHFFSHLLACTIHMFRREQCENMNNTILSLLELHFNLCVFNLLLLYFINYILINQSILLAIHAIVNSYIAIGN